jgi:tetratricopeptide (TPR) repeat protein
MTQRVTDLVLGELRQAGSVTALDPSAVGKAAAPPPAPAPAPGLQAAERLYAEGRERVKKQEFEEAVQVLAAAARRIEENLAALSDYGLVADVHLWQGIAHHRAGNEDEGRAALRRALVVRPDLQLDPQRYPPLFIRIVERERAQVRGGPRGSLRVSSVPASCEVLANGVLRGRTPLELRDLPAGRHYVHVWCAGHEPLAAARDVPAGGVAAVDLRLTRVSFAGAADPLPPLFARLRQGLADRETAARAHEAAVRALADFAFVGYFAREGSGYALRSFLLRAQDARMTPLSVARLDAELLGAADVAKRLARDVEQAVRSEASVARAPEGRRAAAGTAREVRSARDLARVESELQREELERLAREERERRYGPLGVDFGPKVLAEEPFYKRWWFWAIVGGAVAAGAAGAVVGATAGGPGSGNVGLRWTPR